LFSNSENTMALTQAARDWLTMSGKMGGAESDPYNLGDYAKGATIGNSGLAKRSDESVDEFVERVYTMSQDPGFGSQGRSFNELQNAGFGNELQPVMINGQSYNRAGSELSKHLNSPAYAAIVNQNGGASAAIQDPRYGWLIPSEMYQKLGLQTQKENANWINDNIPIIFGALATGGVVALGAGAAGAGAAGGAGAFEGAIAAGELGGGLAAGGGGLAAGGGLGAFEGAIAGGELGGAIAGGTGGVAGGGAVGGGAVSGADAFAGATAGAEGATGATGWGSYLQSLMSPNSLIPVAGQVAGSLINANSVGNALEAQTQGAANATAEQRRQYDQTRADFEPWRLTGMNALGQLSSGIQPGGQFNSRFTMADLNKDPVYNSGLQFGLDQGTRAIENRARAMGINNSGGTLKALTRFGNDYGSTKAGDSFNRFQTENTNIYNRLAGVAGTGQAAANTVANVGTNTANNIAANEIGMGNARGAASIAQGNAFTGGINNLMQYYQGQQLLDRLPRYTMSGF
jgi:hypothetical protein